MNNKGIIFIHGAGLGSYIWDELKPRLDLPALAVDFPNRNKGAKVNQLLSFQDYANSVISQVEKWDIEKLILVTHSIGGCVGLKVAEHFDKRIVGFAGISSAIPLNGNSFVSCLPFTQRNSLPLLLKLAGTKPPQIVIEKTLGNDLSYEMMEMVVKRFTPESRYLYTEKCHANIPETKRLYVILSNDKLLPLSMQHRMALNLEAQYVQAIHSGHLPMLSHAEELAWILNDFCKDV